ncbi:MAG: cellulase family glycosylhydrolase, partial [Frankiales bacterium]|nr:cellulase family glycosylhydrolase [Frankiales bacterium]
MRRRLAIAAAVLSTAALPLAALAAPSARVSERSRTAGVAAVGHAGRWIVDGSGRVVIDHGFNVVSKLAPFDPARNGFGRDDARFLAAHGFTAVRFGVLLQGVEPAPGRYDDRYVASIRRTVDLLGRYGIRSLLDFHQDLYSQRYQGEGLPAWMALDDGLPAQPQAGFPGDYFGMPALWRALDNLWTNAPGPGSVGLRDRYAEALGHVAKAFRGDPAVLGYDVFNEPFPGSPYLSCFPPRGCPEQ